MKPYIPKNCKGLLSILLLANEQYFRLWNIRDKCLVYVELLKCGVFAIYSTLTYIIRNIFRKQKTFMQCQFVITNNGLYLQCMHQRFCIGNAKIANQ